MLFVLICISNRNVVVLKWCRKPCRSVHGSIKIALTFVSLCGLLSWKNWRAFGNLWMTMIRLRCCSDGDRQGISCQKPCRVFCANSRTSTRRVASHVGLPAPAESQRQSPHCKFLPFDGFWSMRSTVNFYTNLNWIWVNASLRNMLKISAATNGSGLFFVPSPMFFWLCGRICVGMPCLLPSIPAMVLNLSRYFYSEAQRNGVLTNLAPRYSGKGYRNIR